MKLKRVIGAFIAAAVAVSAMAVNAFAISSQYFYKLQDQGWEDYTRCYGARITISGDFSTTGVGGCIAVNSPSTGWEQHEWGMESDGKELSLNADNQIIIQKSKPLYKADESYAEIAVQQWWGEFEIVSVEMLDADGNVLSASADGEAPAEEPVEEPDVEEPVVEEPTVEEPAPVEEPASDSASVPAATGNTSAAALAAAAVIAGAVSVKTRRK